MIPNILSIAGSDPSGGAGIQADIKAISATGGYAMAALTALTAQNTRGVTGVELVPAAFVAAQIRTVFDDVAVSAVKIGMVATAEIAEAVAGALEAAAAPRIVLDPVMIAKGGDRLLAEDAVAALSSRLLPLAAVITPNLPEAAALVGRPPITTRADMEETASALLALGPGAVLLKGGHLAGPESPDLLAARDGCHWLEGRRTATRNTHGTGCTLSAALATELGFGHPPLEAAKRAKVYVAASIAAADRLDVGSGHGPLHHFYAREP